MGLKVAGLLLLDPDLTTVLLCCITYLGQLKQESLANTKVSARQPWYIGRNSLNRLPLRKQESWSYSAVKVALS